MSTCNQSPYAATPVERTLYMRPLPASLTALDSESGRAVFRRALLEGTLEGYFKLAQQFHTQADPAFCGLGSLVCALNALGIDPRRRWKGSWRWFSEELLDCCKPLDKYPPHWMPVDVLFAAMQERDAATGEARGWLVLTC
jgi:glutathione gamma-glutamylcysteinyltransferase